MAFRIEMFYDGEWVDEPDVCSYNYDDGTNRFPEKRKAEKVLDEMSKVGFIRDRLRVAEID